MINFNVCNQDFDLQLLRLHSVYSDIPKDALLTLISYDLFHARIKGTQRRFPPKLNTLKILFRLFRVSLDLLKCIRSVILRELKSFRIYEGFSVIFPKKLLQYDVLRGETFFLIPLSITLFNLKILGFLFSTKNSLAWGVKREKLNFRKS